MGKGLTIILSLFALLLGIVIGFETMLWQPLDSHKMPEASSHSITANRFEKIDEPPEFRLPGFRLYREVTERSLFSKDRRPSNSRQPGSQMADFPKDLVLQGIYSTADKRIAVLFDERQNKKLYMSRNQQLAGWRIVKITTWGLILVKGPHQKILHLKSANENEDTVHQDQSSLLP